MTFYHLLPIQLVIAFSVILIEPSQAFTFQSSSSTVPFSSRQHGRNSSGKSGTAAVSHTNIIHIHTHNHDRRARSSITRLATRESKEEIAAGSSNNRYPTMTEEYKRETVSNRPAPPNNTQRSIDKVEKFARLPVWPVWNGVIIFFLSQLFGLKIGAQLEDYFGGRVCPNFFSGENPNTSPFIMMVHHRHSFAIGDPLRFFQRTFFPEGFPSHPHRGFTTVTYVLKGGFIHRDSLGVRQTYGAMPKHEGRHTQWLNTGAGMLHEEMWDNKQEEWWKPVDQELYQIWLNCPSQHKLDDPTVQLLGGEESTPTVTLSDSNNNLQTQTIVLCGEYNGQRASVQTYSPVSMLHVIAEPGSTWRYTIPSTHQTAILYMRRGCGTIGDTAISTHYTAYLSRTGDEIVFKAVDEDGKPCKADFMLMCGKPLDEPVAAQGSMVMNNDMEVQRAYQDYEAQKMGAPWDHKLSDGEWRNHAQRFPSVYRTDDDYEQ